MGQPTWWVTRLRRSTGLIMDRPLAIVLPAMWKVRREEKREKLLQYAERVWGLKEGDEDARIDGAIEKTKEFF